MRFEYGDDTPVTRRGRAAEGCRNGGFAKEPTATEMAGGALSLSLLTCRRGNRYTFLPTTARSTARPLARQLRGRWGTALSATSPAASADAEDDTARPPGRLREGRTRRRRRRLQLREERREREKGRASRGNEPSWRRRRPVDRPTGRKRTHRLTDRRTERGGGEESVAVTHGGRREGTEGRADDGGTRREGRKSVYK